MVDNTVIIPYRDRLDHLRRFVPHILSFLRLTSFKLLVIEQGNQAPFNRGWLLNVGFLLSALHTDWITLHDVDMLPLDGGCNYSKPHGIRHLAGRAQQYAFQLPYCNYVGGVVVCSKSAFTAINGFSNEYCGWGSEDDDFFLRAWRAGIAIERSPGQYLSLSHDRAPRAPRNAERLQQVVKELTITVGGTTITDPRQIRRIPVERMLRKGDPSVEVVDDGLTTTTFILESRQLLSDILGFKQVGAPHEIVVVR